MKNQTLSKYLDDVTLYFQMLKDFFSGRYKNIPIGSIATIIGTLLYVLSPIDLIPDVLPGGFFDDLGILIACLNFTKFDVDEYIKSKDENQQKQMNQGIEKQTFISRLMKFLARTTTHRNLFGLAVNKGLDIVVPYLSDKIIRSRVCPLVKEKLDTFYKNTIVNSLITLVLNIIGVLFVIFDPFGVKVSCIIAYTLFFVAISFTIYRFVSFIVNKKYREVCIQLIQSVWRTKSIANGIKEVVLINITNLAMLYKGIDIISNFFPALEKVPDVQGVIKYIIGLFGKRLAWFIGVFAIYTIMFYFIIKPLLLSIFL